MRSTQPSGSAQGGHIGGFTSEQFFAKRAGQFMEGRLVASGDGEQAGAMVGRL
jgi:hypothetical protein